MNSFSVKTIRVGAGFAGPHYFLSGNMTVCSANTVLTKEECYLS